MYRIAFLFLIISQQVLAQGFCQLHLGNDTTVCFPDTLVLNAGSGYTTYNWSTGATTQTISVSQPGMYYVSVHALGPQAVVNGNFSQGNTGFTSGYLYATNLYPEGTYWVGANANSVHPNFVGTALSPPGFMVVNGSSNPSLNVWCQSIANITPNTTYQFSAWICSVAPGNPAILQFRVNNVPLSAPFTAPVGTGSWVQYTATWNSGTNTTASICIQNQNTALGGNDFGLDDISFIPVCNTTDTIHIFGEQQAQVNLNVPDSICPTKDFFAQATPAGGYWGGNAVIDTAFGIYNFETPGYYQLYYVVPGDCGDADTTFIFVGSVPEPDLGEDFELCPGDWATLGPLSAAAQTIWSTGAMGASIQISDTGTYWVRQINKPGCEAYDTIVVHWRCPMAPVIEVPNVFTPNEDGLNDSFKITNQYIGKSDIKIYNRWGNLVYQSQNIDESWDGRSQAGDWLASGVYFYVLIYEGSEIKGEKQMQGNITLMR